MEFVLVVLLLMVSVFWVWRSRFGRGPILSKTEKVDLATDPRAGALYQLSTDDQHLLVHAVEHFCVQQYLRDTCIQHLITCGAPCLVVIPKPQRAKIFADYQVLRQSRGLPPITPIVRSDDD